VIRLKRSSIIGLAAVLVAVHTAYGDPSITSAPTGEWDPGQLVWADLLTDDVAAARQFYAEVFGWQFVGDDTYLQASNKGMPVAGIAYHEPREPDVSEVVWLVSISVEDVDNAAAAVPGAGGQVLEGPSTVAQRGRYAVVEDGQGAVFAILRSEQGDPPDRKDIDNEWIWGELWTRVPERAEQFYAAVAGYDSREIQSSNGSYTALVRGGKPRTGIVELPWDDVLPHWLPYLRVADVGETIGRVERAGGQVLLAPSAAHDEGTVAIVSDPTGGVFAIQAPRRAQ
jgi:predicted enzyme related to lactoylglutathione lyase